MKRETYQRGLPGVKWGIWNCQKIGDDAKKWRFEPRQLPGKYATFSPVL